MKIVKEQLIIVAQKRLKADHEFSGLLPIGDYTFIGHPFSIDTGVDIKLEISPNPLKDQILCTAIYLNRLIKEEI